MTKMEFLSLLDQGLKKLPFEERQGAIRYYAEYFEDAGTENEQKVIEEFGSPAKIASQILADFALKDMQNNPGSAKKGLSNVWVVIIAIFASPVALPLAIAVATVAFSLVIVAFAIIFSFAAVALSLLLSGIFVAVMGFSQLFLDPATSVFFIGSGLVLAAVGALFAVLVVIISRTSFTGIAKLISKCLKRGKHHA